MTNEIERHEPESGYKTTPNNNSNIATALSKAQGVMQGAKKDKKNPFFHSSYSTLASVFDAIRDPFSSNGLSVSQMIDVKDDGKQILRTQILHSSGEFLESRMWLPIELNPQKMGSAITYARRYSLMAIAGIPSEDDDGNQASGKPAPVSSYISQQDVSNLESLINGNARVRKLVLANCNQNLSSITVDRLSGAIKWIKHEIAKDSKLEIDSDND